MRGRRWCGRLAHAPRHEPEERGEHEDHRQGARRVEARGPRSPDAGRPVVAEVWPRDVQAGPDGDDDVDEKLEVDEADGDHGEADHD